MPKSHLIKKTQDMLDDSIKELKGLNDLSIKVIHFFLDEFMGISNYRMRIIPGDNMELIISVLDKAGKEVSVKPKNDELFEALAIKAGIPNYTIRFARRGEIFNEEK